MGARVTAPNPLVVAPKTNLRQTSASMSGGICHPHPGAFQPVAQCFDPRCATVVTFAEDDQRMDP
jgi:hypothetical protein